MRAVPHSIVEAGMLAMRETREQLRELRKEAEARIFMTDDYHRERARVQALEKQARDDPPPKDPIIPGYKRHNFAARRLKGGR